MVWALASMLVLGASLVVDTARAGTQIGLYETHAGHVDFVGTAGSLRSDSNLGNSCGVDNIDFAPLADIPAGATIRAAYLYWAGSWSTVRGSNQRTPDWDVTFEGTNITADRTFTEVFRLGRNRYNFFSGMKDVTEIVSAKGNGLYSFGDLDVNTSSPHCDAQAVLAGWSLIVVFEHPDESHRVVNVFDGFQVFRGGQVVVTVNGFQISASDINGKVGHLTWEGDPENSNILDGFSENLIFNGTPLIDSLNPVNNQFNSTVNAYGSNNQWGVDLDIYDVTPYLNAGDTQATTVYRSGQDLVLLSAEVISVTNVPLTDLGFTAEPDDPMGLYEPGQILINLVNYGPSNEEQPMTISASLPSGLTYTGTSTGDWTVDDNAWPNLVWTHPGPLNVGQNLPLVFQVLPLDDAVGTPNMNVEVNGGSFDHNLTNNSGKVPLNVIIPTAELASASFTQAVADPINGEVNPKAIPGASLIYTVTTSNIRAGQVDDNSVMVLNPVPPNTMLFVTDFPGTSDGPILFMDGVPSSGLSLWPENSIGAHSRVNYSSDGGTSFNYQPVPDAMGYDPRVTHFRVRLHGVFNGRDVTGASSFSLKFKVMLI
ncbi:MAG: DUF3344 domain-containing protein [Gammaproteobacteria bacterium]|nr:DUF3344 domain-containing protein [Gammaproteobacteria bacterium]